MLFSPHYGEALSYGGEELLWQQESGCKQGGTKALSEETLA